jgi:hypothetical protein
MIISLKKATGSCRAVHFFDARPGKQRVWGIALGPPLTSARSVALAGVFRVGSAVEVYAMGLVGRFSCMSTGEAC